MKIGMLVRVIGINSEISWCTNKIGLIIRTDPAPRSAKYGHNHGQPNFGLLIEDKIVYFYKDEIEEL